MNALLQLLAEQYFPNAINFLATNQSDWDISNVTLTSFENGVLTLQGTSNTSILTGTMTYKNLFSGGKGKTLSLVAESWHTNKVSDGSTYALLEIEVSEDGVIWAKAISAQGENINTAANVKTPLSGSYVLSGNEKYIRIVAGTTAQAHLTSNFNFNITELKIS